MFFSIPNFHTLSNPVKYLNENQILREASHFKCTETTNEDLEHYRL